MHNKICSTNRTHFYYILAQIYICFEIQFASYFQSLLFSGLNFLCREDLIEFFNQILITLETHAQILLNCGIFKFLMTVVQIKAQEHALAYTKLIEFKLKWNKTSEIVYYIKWIYQIVLNGKLFLHKQNREALIVSVRSFIFKWIHPRKKNFEQYETLHFYRPCVCASCVYGCFYAGNG